MPSRDILLLGELADALSGVHTIPATGRAFVQAVRKHLPLSWFELGKRDAQTKERERGFQVMVFIGEEHGIAVTLQQRGEGEVPVADESSGGVRRYRREMREGAPGEWQALPR